MVIWLSNKMTYKLIRYFKLTFSLNFPIYQQVWTRMNEDLIMKIYVRIVSIKLSIVTRFILLDYYWVQLFVKRPLCCIDLSRVGT